MSTELQ